MFARTGHQQHELLVSKAILIRNRQQDNAQVFFTKTQIAEKGTAMQSPDIFRKDEIVTVVP